MKTRKIKALCVKQPYASDILTGIKKIEYRSWRTRYRGDVLIIASRKPKIKGMPCGMALCFVEIFDVTGDKRTCFEWHLRNVRPLERFIPVKGKLGVFDLTWPIEE